MAPLLEYMTGHSPKMDTVGFSDLDNQALDTTFDLLANQRRRYILECLSDNTQPITLTDLAEDVAVHENERPLTEIPNETVQAISTSLSHAHIPKLADAGAVEHDSDQDLVSTPETESLAEYFLFLGADGGNER